MTKQELIDHVASTQKKREISKAATAEVIESLFDNLGLALKRRRKFTYPGFGTFLVKKRKERRGRNPQTGEEMIIPSKKTVVLKVCQAVRERMNGKT